MLHDPAKKYVPFAPVRLSDRTWPDQQITKAPIWASVDLRDGNQALIEPMNVQRKLKLFQCLIDIGFTEIEVGFPSASQTEFDFTRHIIEHKLIPDNVYIQVLTQARPHLIERTFEALRGAKKAIVHVYNSTAPVMRRVVFNQDTAGIKKIATDHARLILACAKKETDTQWRFEYSPEMFSSTELPFAKEICDAVCEAFEASPQQKLILNLPSTVEGSTPNIYADQIEWMHKNLAYRDSVILSLHPHNDRGTSIASAELGLMAGAERIEGCLFGNGERTGNVDLINLALNLYTQGVAPGLKLDQIDEVRRIAEYCTNIPVHARHPYVGDLVYTSFSGSHQDAIKKSFAQRKETDLWQVPYLPIDPKDLGRDYEAVIRVNSQSGKGGITYLLETEYGIQLPRRMQIEFSRVVQNIVDLDGGELGASDIWEIFQREYLQYHSPLHYISHHLVEDSTRAERVDTQIDVQFQGQITKLHGTGNGPIDGLVCALGQLIREEIRVLDYHEHAIGHGANATAACYVEMQIASGAPLFGVGLDPNIVTASFKAIFSGLNRAAQDTALTPAKTEAPLLSK